MGACLPDFYDANKKASDGCETYCQKTNGGVEICDGRDNDCNGVIDDNVAPPTIVCRSQGSICQGIVPVCMGSMGYVCPYRTGYQDIEDTTLGCDGLDNDCDGQTDEPFLIGKSCVAGHGHMRRGDLGLRQHADRQSPLPGDQDRHRWRSATASTTTATARSTSSASWPTRTTSRW